MNEKIKKLAMRVTLAVGVSCTGSMAALPAHAQALENWLAGPTMTGNWGGARTKLKDDGFIFKGVYVGEFADAFTGGNRQGAAYAQQFGFGVDADLGKIANIDGGTFHLAFIQRQGRSASTDFTGNKLNFQEEFGLGEDFRMTALNYEQYLASKTINIKVGFQSMGDDFEATSFSCTFQNVGFCGHSQSLPNDSGWGDYPSARWGGRLKYFPVPDVYVETGLYDVNPTDSLGPNGLKVSFSGSTGVLVPVEIGLKVSLGPNALVGHYKIGGYYDSSTVKALQDTPSTDMLAGRYGGYISFDQMVWTPEPGTPRGLLLFIQATLSDDRTALMPTYIDGGIVDRGPFASRLTDFVNFGFIRAGVNHHLVTLNRNELIAKGDEDFTLQIGETLLEMGYGFKPIPWLLIHPNIQYDIAPGAFAFKHYTTAWAFGLQTAVIF